MTGPNGWYWRLVATNGRQLAVRIAVACTHATGVADAGQPASIVIDVGLAEIDATGTDFLPLANELPLRVVSVGQLIFRVDRRTQSPLSAGAGIVDEGLRLPASDGARHPACAVSAKRESAGNDKARSDAGLVLRGAG